jgi:hypothetical protein
MAVLEWLGIPRVRVLGLSLFNFLGTFALAIALAYWTPLGHVRSPTALCCASLPLAVGTHALLGEPTPLVLLVRRHWQWRLVMALLACIAYIDPMKGT